MVQLLGRRGWLCSFDVDDVVHWRCRHPSPSGSPGPPFALLVLPWLVFAARWWLHLDRYCDYDRLLDYMFNGVCGDFSDCDFVFGADLRAAAPGGQQVPKGPRISTGDAQLVLAFPWTPMAYNMFYDFVLYDFAPITVLLLLVVEVYRKGRENPPVMRRWWAFSVLLHTMASSGTSMAWTTFYDLELIALLLRTVVVMLRKGREYLLVLRNRWVVPVALDYVLLEALGLP
ncbi:unnamed protein product [Symbiodinium sp. KB8]|nr:unnamed protein product [Symbiodinium sp. KB8]